VVTSEVIKKTLKTYVTQKDPVVRAERRAKSQVRVKTSKVLVTRHIPTATRDRVFVRDGARCSYVSAEGKRCSETHNLQIDHCRPWAKGGGHEEDNLRVLCPTHNRFVAEQVFGKDKVPSKVRR
jgi:5-methylcytosine-specific restriction endonuclease McrA